MTIADQMNLITKGLADWAKTNGGSVKIANDIPHLFTIRGANPGAPRAAVLFAGETPRNAELDLLGRVDRKFYVAVSRGRGFKLNQGESLTEGVAGGKPMFVLVEEAREVLRSLRLSDLDDEPEPYYRGIDLLTFEGVTTDCLRIEIQIAAQIPDQVDYDAE